MKNYFFLISSTCNWPWKDTFDCRVSPLWHLQPVLHFCKMRNGQITFNRKIFWTIFFHHIIGHDKLHFCAKLKVHDPYTLGATSPTTLKICIVSFHFAKYSKPMVFCKTKRNETKRNETAHSTQSIGVMNFPFAVLNQ